VTVRRVMPEPAVGSVRAPPSKSYTHRALVAGHLTGHAYAVRSPLDADDTRATARAVTTLGTRVLYRPACWMLEKRRTSSARDRSIDCGESGTTLRFVAALAARGTEPVTLLGRGRLPQRPIEPLWTALEQLGATCERPNGRRGLPTVVRGPVHGGSVALDASVSSQFASSLLLALPTVEGSSLLELHGPVVSEPYIEATLAVLRFHRVRVDRRGRQFRIPGGQSYSGRGMTVPGDASSAAYLWAAAALTGGCVTVRGVSTDWPQADLAILPILRQAGARVRVRRDGATVEGGTLRPFSVDLTGAPDLYPLAGVLAAAIPGTSELRGAPQVVHKESDRRAETVTLVRKMGADARPTKRGLSVRGTARPRGFRLPGLTDHRIVMSAAVAARAAASPSEIGDARAVAKSFPDFWNVLASLREGELS